MNLTLAKFVDRYVGMLVCFVLMVLRQLRGLVSPRDSLIDTPRTILLIKFWGVGNVVLLVPVLRALRDRYPDARLVFVSFRRNRQLLDHCTVLDERIYIDDRNVLTLLWTLSAAVLRARRGRPDLCVDFEQFAHSSAILAVLSRAQQIVGLEMPGQLRAVLFHQKIPYDDGQHMGQTYLDLAVAAGVPRADYRPEPLELSSAHAAEADQLLTDAGAVIPDRPIAVLHPGSGDNFQGRRWPAASFARLADRLVHDEGLTVVVTGTAAEAPVVRDVIDAMRHPAVAVDATGRLSALGLAALIERSVFLVSNDTAPVHIGSAQGVAVFALFGPNTPRLYGPRSTGSHAFYRALPCSPCLTNMNYKTSRCRMPVCIRDIEVGEVFERIHAHLEELRDAGRLGRAPAAQSAGTAPHAEIGALDRSGA